MSLSLEFTGLNDAAQRNFDAIVKYLKAQQRPAGEIVPTVRTSAPAGFVMADGAEVAADHTELIAALSGNPYGVGPNGRPRVPDLEGVTLMGRDAGQAEFATLGANGGVKTVTLTVAQMPSHAHSDGTLTTAQITQPRAGGTVADNFNSYAANPGYTAVDGWFTGATADVTGQTGNNGSGQAHDNLPPYVVVNFMVKT